jgi:hypothetical protein
MRLPSPSARHHSSGVTTVREEGSSLSRRCSSRLTPHGCHLPPRAVGISRSFNSRAIALNETRPVAWSARIVEARALARASAACLVACPMLILPLPDVIKPRRVSILTTVVRCQLPPKTVGIPLRFNSPANSRWERKPASRSCRMVEAKAAARESAARLFVEAPCTRPRDDVAPLNCSIGQTWPDLEVPSQG